MGTVETPIFHGVSREPDFLVIRVIDSMPGTFRVVPSTVVEDVDIELWVMTVGMTGEAFSALPEGLPFARRTT